MRVGREGGLRELRVLREWVARIRVAVDMVVRIC